MDKKKWEESFEEIHSRKPSNEEIEQALKIGEISEETLPKKETLVEIVGMSEESVTKNTNDDFTDFKLDEPSPKSKNIKDNETIAQTTAITKSYFSWLFETLKNPITKGKDYNQSYPWITMGLISFFIALSITVYLRNFYASTLDIGTSLINTFSNNTSDYNIANPFGFNVFLGTFIFVAILIVTLAFSTWVGLKIMGSSLTFTNVVDQYASLYVPVVVLIALSSVLMLIKLTPIAVSVFLLAIMILFISWYFIIFNAKNERKLDDFYAKLLALLGGWAILGAIFFILSTLLVAKLVTLMSPLF